jgi:uncharacterized protein YecT (DUF1311 family)
MAAIALSANAHAFYPGGNTPPFSQQYQQCVQQYGIDEIQDLMRKLPSADAQKLATSQQAWETYVRTDCELFGDHFGFSALPAPKAKAIERNLCYLTDEQNRALALRDLLKNLDQATR